MAWCVLILSLETLAVSPRARRPAGVLRFGTPVCEPQATVSLSSPLEMSYTAGLPDFTGGEDLQVPAGELFEAS